MEPASCAIHGLDKLRPPVGVEALVFGAGPTGEFQAHTTFCLIRISIFSRLGIILAQLLKLNGASRVVIVANRGIKTQIARQLDAGDEYVELERDDSRSQWAKIKEDFKEGFDVVVTLL